MTGDDVAAAVADIPQNLGEAAVGVGCGDGSFFPKLTVVILSTFAPANVLPDPSPVLETPHSLLESQSRVKSTQSIPS
jgi:hypothetical protein